jgi:large subunit ribosomal protein L18
MLQTSKIHQSRQHRHRRLRAKISGTADRPRLAVARSLNSISAQLIDDVAGKTLVAATERELTGKPGTKTERAIAVGKLIATKAGAKKITSVVYDRGGRQYHGRIKALADSARAEGLKF